MTLRVFSAGLEVVPTITSWYLSELGESKGRQELFTKQSPQRLKVLREHALIESAVSSNRIEGVTVEQQRIHTVVLGRANLHNRDEEEVRGYRNALKLIHEQSAKLPTSEDTIHKLHYLARGETGDAGLFKTKDGDIIEKYPDGRTRIRFKTVAATLTPSYIKQLTLLWSDSLQEHQIHPLIALAAFNLDFLCIHPFRDGNGRVSRLLMLLQLYQLGYEVGCYISIERIIEQNKERYYETLEQSSNGWHEGKHDPWPYINYVLFTLKTAYREFEDRVGQVTSPRGAKTELISNAINNSIINFRVADIQKQCPSVSVDMIRKVLKTLQAEGKVQCLGRGQSARWQKIQK